MLTPKFELDQENNHIVISIHAPYTKVSDVEIHIDDKTFIFYAKPYLLNLTFPRSVNDDGSSCKYEVDSGIYTVRVVKAISGEEFENLDLLTTLLQKKSDHSKKSFPSIEIVSEDDQSTEAICGETDCLVEEDECYTTNDQADSLQQYGYGFANQKSCVLSQLKGTEIPLLFQQNPDFVQVDERRALREEAENKKFDSDHYLADLYDDEEMTYALNFAPWWRCEQQMFAFDSTEKAQLLKLPNREHLLDDRQRRIVLLGLVELLFAYAYDHRTTEGEASVESAWTIRTLSPTLSWCDTQRPGDDDLRSTVRACFRRALCYPRFRSWKLCATILSDVGAILTAGRRPVIRALLSLHATLEHDDTAPSFLLNRLYLADYCVWAQRVPDAAIAALARHLAAVDVAKADVGLELDLLELAADMVARGEMSDDGSSTTTTATASDDDDGDSESDVTSSDYDAVSSDCDVTSDSDDEGSYHLAAVARKFDELEICRGTKRGAVESNDDLLFPAAV